MQSNVLLPVCMHSCKVHSSLAPPEDAKLCRRRSHLAMWKTEGGLFTDYARFSPSYEWASEFTWKIPCSGNGFIQPTLHFIQQAGAHYLIGLLRFSYVLPAT